MQKSNGSMNPFAELLGHQREVGAIFDESVPFPLIDHFGDPAGEYDVLGIGPALFHHSSRGLIHVTGKDRAPWLHNLCTQNIKVLPAGEGIYAYVLNVKGRILFDMNVWIDEDSIWLDVDRRFLPLAMAHLQKYTVVEDVAVADRSDEFVRFVLLGTLALGTLVRFGLERAPHLAQLQHVKIERGSATKRMIRHDLCGVFASELVYPVDEALYTWRALIREGAPERIRPVGYQAVNLRRIEAGVPWPMTEITDDTLPAETGQLSRAVNFNKGCYLGQEIVERMRSRGGLARTLVGLRFISGANPHALGTGTLLRDGKPTGRLTSLCRSPRLKAWIGLGYAKVTDASPDTLLHLDSSQGHFEARTCSLPFIPNG